MTAPDTGRMTAPDTGRMTAHGTTGSPRGTQGSDLVLRRVREDEAPAYRALLHAAYAPTAEQRIGFQAAGATEEQVLTHLRGNVAWALADAGTDEVAATISVRFPWGPNPGPFPLPHLGWLAVDPARARQGLGTRMMQAVEEHLHEELHTPAVSLGTAAQLQWLRDFYRRRGYLEGHSTDLGLGHLTVYYVRPLDPAGFAAWSRSHPDLTEGLTS